MKKQMVITKKEFEANEISAPGLTGRDNNINSKQL